MSAGSHRRMATRVHSADTGKAHEARRRVLGLLLSVALGGGSGAAAAAREPPVVAVAANMAHAAAEIARDYEQAHGRRVRLSVGSSGNLYRQIVEGAPFELFLSADAAFVDRLLEQGLAHGPAITYAIGRIGLFVPAGSVLAAAAIRDPESLLRAAAAQALAITIANPRHAPYGRAAREVLETLGLWETVSARLVIGENVGQTVQFALSGSVDLGVIPLSYARLPEVRARGTYVPLPGDWYTPLVQRMVLTNRASPAARAFFDYLQSDPARAVLARYGYGLP